MAAGYSWKDCKMQNLSEEEYLGKFKVKGKTKTKTTEEFQASGTYSYSKY